MTARRPLERAAVVLVLALLFGGAACSRSDGGARDVQIRIRRLEGRAWTATGPAVDDGVICPSGIEALVDFSELDGTPITLSDFGRRREAAIMAFPPDETTDHLQVMEFSCADGTGALTLVVEERNGGLWQVRDGTGAYAELTGSGIVDVERLLIDEDWAPPGGVPLHDHLTGTVEVVDEP